MNPFNINHVIVASFIKAQINLFLKGVPALWLPFSTTSASHNLLRWGHWFVAVMCSHPMVSQLKTSKQQTLLKFKDVCLELPYSASVALQKALGRESCFLKEVHS